MVSLKQAIANAVARKRVPAFSPSDAGDIASKLGLRPPVSLKKLIQTLDDLPPAIKTIKIGAATTPGGVSASGQIGLQSDGYCSFRGSVSNPSAGGINYLYGVALLDIKDSSGKALVLATSGNLFNLVEGSSTTFQQDSFAQSVADNWDAAKNTGWHATISDSDDAFDDLLQALTDVLLVVVTFGIFLAIPAGDGPGGGADCQWANTNIGSNTANFSGCTRIK